jgi:hypothetical protein
VKAFRKSKSILDCQINFTPLARDSPAA